MRARVSGGAFTIQRTISAGMDAIVQDVIRRALADAEIRLSDVDAVITVASDALDGMMVPVRSDMVGALGKSFLNMPSSAGHALMAAATAIEADEAETVLLVGWGAASKLSEFDSRSNQFDPFYLRPLGVSVATLQAMQAQFLIDQGLITERGIDSYASDMNELVWSTVSQSGFCDGAVAIVLQKAAHSGLVIEQFCTSSRAQLPLDGNLDPKSWLDEVTAKLGARSDHAGPFFLEVCGQNTLVELRVLTRAKGSCATKEDDIRANAHGGSAQAWFGPASPLRNLAALHAASAEGPQNGALFDLAGPLGQHVTGILFSAGESHAA